MGCQSDFVSQVLDLSDCPSAYEQLPPTAGCLFREAQAGLREELSTAFQVIASSLTFLNTLLQRHISRLKLSLLRFGEWTQVDQHLTKAGTKKISFPAD